MKYLYTISLCLVLTFFVSIDITKANPTQQLQPAPQVGLNCGTRACSPPNICINRGGQPQCVNDEANSSGVCQGDSNFRCPAGQACVKDSSGELGCEVIFSQAGTNQENQQNTSGTTGVGTNPTGLLDGLNSFRDSGSGLNTTGTLIGYVANIIRWILSILGTVFFMIIVIQGYLYMTAGGDSSKTAAALGAIGNAVVGLLIIMGAFLITNFVTSGVIDSGGGTSTTGTEQQNQPNNNRNNNNGRR